MTANTGSTDRIFRIAAGIGLIALAFVGPQTPWGFLGLVPLLTGLVGYCPAYGLFGVNTCGKRQS